MLLVLSSGMRSLDDFGNRGETQGVRLVGRLDSRAVRIAGCRVVVGQGEVATVTQGPNGRLDCRLVTRNLAELRQLRIFGMFWCHGARGRGMIGTVLARKRSRLWR